ncbi:hypothetical protein BZL30_1394 [Mycobacterium kansasii]|uniref:Uncharacterized protein n=1 Tax=Mycobacterium kansasii TaxID=1768 RepID=A0A1V3XTG9_MYCKA|nr:hypothetical protein BZL30_1394 [Mycobacterium kansasii]
MSAIHPARQTRAVAWAKVPNKRSGRPYDKNYGVDLRA